MVVVLTRCPGPFDRGRPEGASMDGTGSWRGKGLDENA